MLSLGRSRACGVTVLLVLTLVVATQAPAATVLGAETPQALVARMGKAAEANNLAELVACLEPQSRAKMTMGLAAGAAMMVAFMGMGSDMAGGMAEGMTGGEMKAGDKAKLEKGKAEASAKVDKAKSELSAVFKKHGFPDLLAGNAALPQDKDPVALLAKVDQPALVADIFNFMDTMGDKKGETGGAPKVPSPKDVTDYAISGDRATAKAAGEALKFVKVDGRWFFVMPDKDKS